MLADLAWIICQLLESQGDPGGFFVKIAVFQGGFYKK